MRDWAAASRTGSSGVAASAALPLRRSRRERRMVPPDVDVVGAMAAGARVAYRDCGTLEWLPMDRSDLLKELQIDRDARPGRARSRRLLVALVALLALGGG